jgi:hypothetical protein
LATRAICRARRERSGTFDISDVIYQASFMFLGGPAPVQGEACFPMEACPANIGCE